MSLIKSRPIHIFWLVGPVLLFKTYQAITFRFLAWCMPVPYPFKPGGDFGSRDPEPCTNWPRFDWGIAPFYTTHGGKTNIKFETSGKYWPEGFNQDVSSNPIIFQHKLHTSKMDEPCIHLANFRFCFTYNNITNLPICESLDLNRNESEEATMHKLRYICWYVRWFAPKMSRRLKIKRHFRWISDGGKQFLVHLLQKVWLLHICTSILQMVLLLNTVVVTYLYIVPLDVPHVINSCSCCLCWWSIPSCCSTLQQLLLLLL